jgi:salicylate hydroxylase
LQKLLEAMPGWRTWALSDRPPLKNADQMGSGRIALLGDAAHPMLPYLAQGAGMAIEDAAALAEALGNSDADVLPQAFARYAEARWQRNARVQARAHRNGTIFHATGPVRLGRDMAMRTLGGLLLDQPWLYRG